MAQESNKQSLIFDIKQSEITEKKQKGERQVMREIDPNE